MCTEVNRLWSRFWSTMDSGRLPATGLARETSGMPEKVRVHEFVIPELGRAIPYGVYDLGTNTRLGECGNRPRHSGVCRGDNPSMVEVGGASTLSAGAATLDHGRCGS
jgi:hypothetical protein